MKPWMTEAMGTQKVVLPSSVVQALLATSEKEAMEGRSFSDAEMALVEEFERGIEGTAGDDVAGGAAFEAGVERGVVFVRRRRVELDGDVRVLGLEGGNDLFLPDGGVVVAPALDGDLAGRGGTRQCNTRDGGEQHGLQSGLQHGVFSPPVGFL